MSIKLGRPVKSRPYYKGQDTVLQFHIVPVLFARFFLLQNMKKKDDLEIFFMKNTWVQKCQAHKPLSVKSGPCWATSVALQEQLFGENCAFGLEYFLRSVHSWNKQTKN